MGRERRLRGSCGERLYNFVRIHKTLKITPAMAAGVSDRLWSMEDVIARIDAVAPGEAKRGPYKKRTA